MVGKLKYLENTSAAFGMDPISLLHNLFQFDLFNKNPQLYLDFRMGFFYILTIAMIVFFVWIFPKRNNLIFNILSAFCNYLWSDWQWFQARSKSRSPRYCCCYSGTLYFAVYCA